MNAQSFHWSKAIQGTFDNKGYCCTADRDGNFCFAGKFSGNVTFGNYELTAPEEIYSVFLFKTDKDGEILWVKETSHVSSSQSVTPYDIRVDEDNNIFLIGQYYHQTQFDAETVLDGYEEGAGDANSDCFIAKYNSNGDLNWAKGFFGPGPDRLEAIAIGGNTIYVGGSFSNTLNIQGTVIESDYPGVGNNSNPFILSLSTTGTVNWIDVFHCESGFCRELAFENDQLFYTIEAKDNIWLQQVGSSEKHPMKKSTGSWDVYLGCIASTTGIAVWDNLIGSSGSDFNYCLDVHENKVVAGGHFINEITFESQDGNLKKATSNGSYDTYFCQYTTEGNLEWIYSLGAEKADGTFGDLVINPEGDILATGYFMSPEINLGEESIFSGGTEAYVLKLNQYGEFQWVQQTLSSDNYAQSHALFETQTGEYQFIGFARGDCNFMAKDFNLTGDNPAQMMFGLIAETQTAFEEFRAAGIHIYPVPTKDVLKVSAEFPILKLTLWDLTGNEVLVAESEKMNLTSVKKGIYILKVDGGYKPVFQRIIKE